MLKKKPINFIFRVLRAIQQQQQQQQHGSQQKVLTFTQQVITVVH